MSALRMTHLSGVPRWPTRLALALGVAIAGGALSLLVARSALGSDWDFVEFRAPDAQDIPAAVAIAPDGAVWFTLESSDAVGVLREGRIERVPRGGETLEALGLAVDARGSVWVTDISGQAIAQLRPDGTREFVRIPGPLAQLGRLSVAPDGSVWFADSSGNSVTRLQDQRLEPHVAAEANAAPFGVAIDHDGVVWATLQIANKLMRIDPSGGTTELDVPTRNAAPTDIAVDPLGGVWFTELRANKIVRFADGRFSEFTVPAEAPGLTSLAIGPDGSVWFTELRRQRLVRLRNGTFTEFALRRPDARPFGVAAAASGDVWYTDLSGWVGKLSAEQARADPLDFRRIIAWLRG
jgi:virginiamycin B lyase